MCFEDSLQILTAIHRRLEQMSKMGAVETLSFPRAIINELCEHLKDNQKLLPPDEQSKPAMKSSFLFR